MGVSRKMQMLEEKFAATERTVAELLQRLREQSDQIVALQAKVEYLTEEIEKRDQTILELTQENKELKRRLGQDSTNSHFPSSRDLVPKPQNNRIPGGKKGAPKGHPGTTLTFSPTPDEIIIQPLNVCPDCQTPLCDVPVKGYQARQVFEMPQPRIWKTEFRVEQKQCPCCRKKQQAAFPEDVRGYVQYGPRLMAFCSYLHAYQLLPLARMSELIDVLTGCKPSEKTLLTQLDKMTKGITPLVEVIHQAVQQGPVLHADETGVRLHGKDHWMHVRSTPNWTVITPHTSRGSEGMQALLPYRGIVVHDCYSSYFKKDTFSFTHALCNVHLLRECKGIVQSYKQVWADKMATLLRESWRTVRAARSAKQQVEAAFIQEVEHRYDDILAKGQAEIALLPVPVKTGPRGRKAKSNAANLAERFTLHKDAVLRFLHHPEVPFDNNQAERDLRMVVVKEKISGCFRADESPEVFATLRSFISTLIKQGLPILASLMRTTSNSFSFSSPEGS